MEINKVLLLNNLLREEVEKYRGLFTTDIQNKLKFSVSAKNTNKVVFDKIIDNSKNKSKILELIEQCNCVIKTISLEENDSLRESISLKTFKYDEICNEEWQNSTLRKYFDNNIFIFVVFKKERKMTKLENIKIWKMTSQVLETGVRDVWEQTKSLVNQGKIVKYIDKRGRYITYFPTSSYTKYIHVRPHAQSREDTFTLPVKDIATGETKFMKHSFWLNSNFVKKIVVKDEFYE